MKKIFLILLLGVIVKLQAQTTSTHSKEIDAYVQFLETQNTSAKDYILQLFDNKDMVLLCERLHPELTQYDMILEVLKDKKFSDKIGQVFIETSGRDQEGNIKKYLNEELSDQEAEDLLMNICRNNSLHPVWDYYCFYYFLKEVRSINQSLPDDQKIQIYPSDLSVKWAELDKESYASEVKSKFPNRDEIMANYIIEKFDAIKEGTSKRKKTLVIMNYRHAFSHQFMYPNNEKPNNVGRFLMDHYGNKMANVFINSFCIEDSSSDTALNLSNIHDGKWDAAFKALGKDNIGFSFENTPFGKDHFDYWKFTPHDFNYADVFDGMVYYHPTSEQKIIFGVPHLVDDVFFKEVKRRDLIVNKPRTDKEIWEINTPTNRLDMFYSDSLQMNINQWLK
ncbi:hypothetical protein MY04_3182 [Flammeovirga sp. MY04]|uniref:hypothetical protein n=1 Tax=Flammeovirga sp. MY04 TaxID=1191459 RepID=UPI0008061029|nr:hypothetical protein [Flammeovirga sp. MY04]ANQ50547.1 hypothetical protein MY04_3182 [Flammeovirga sp. MY04]